VVGESKRKGRKAREGEISFLRGRRGKREYSSQSSLEKGGVSCASGKKKRRGTPPWLGENTNQKRGRRDFLSFAGSSGWRKGLVMDKRRKKRKGGKTAAPFREGKEGGKGAPMMLETG